MIILFLLAKLFFGSMVICIDVCVEDGGTMISEENRGITYIESCLVDIVKEILIYYSLPYQQTDKGRCFDFKMVCSDELEWFAGKIQVTTRSIAMNIKSSIVRDNAFYSVLELINLVKNRHCKSHLYVDINSNIITSSNVISIDGEFSQHKVEEELLRDIVYFQAFTPGFLNVLNGNQTPQEAFEAGEEVLAVSSRLIFRFTGMEV